MVEGEAVGRAAERETRPDLLIDLIGLTAIDRPHGARDRAGRIRPGAGRAALGRGRLTHQLKARRVDHVRHHHVRGRIRSKAPHADGIGRDHADLSRVGRNRLGVQGDVGDRRDIIAGGRAIVRQVEFSGVRRRHFGRVVESAALDRTIDADDRRLGVPGSEVGYGPADAAVACRIGRRPLTGAFNHKAGGETVGGVIDEVGQVVGDDHGARRIAAQVANGETQIEGGVVRGDRQRRGLGPGTSRVKADFLDDLQVGLVRRRARGRRGAIVGRVEVARQGAERRAGRVAQAQIDARARHGLKRQNRVGADRQAARPNQFTGDLEPDLRTGPGRSRGDIGLVRRHRIDNAQRIGRVIVQDRRPQIADRDRAGHLLTGLDRVRALDLAGAQVGIRLDDAIAGVGCIIVHGRVRDARRRRHRGGIDGVARRRRDRRHANGKHLGLAGRQAVRRATDRLSRRQTARGQGRQNFELGRDRVDNDGAGDRQGSGVADRQLDIDVIALNNRGGHGFTRRQVGAGFDRCDDRNRRVIAAIRVQHGRAGQADEGVVGDRAAAGQHPSLDRNRRQGPGERRPAIVAHDRGRDMRAGPVAAGGGDEVEVAGGGQVVGQADSGGGVGPGVQRCQRIGQDAAAGDGMIRLIVGLGHRQIGARLNRRRDRQAVVARVQIHIGRAGNRRSGGTRACRRGGSRITNVEIAARKGRKIAIQGLAARRAGKGAIGGKRRRQNGEVRRHGHGHDRIADQIQIIIADPDGEIRLSPVRHGIGFPAVG
ncbi:hypothetical protein D3C86_820470 [compost metagenome]